MPATSALVIGGSLAGMCAARVLSDVFDQVTIIERDAYPSAPDFRNGVPQGPPIHNLLARGLLEFESFFPGFEARMREARGGTRGDRLGHRDAVAAWMGPARPHRTMATLRQPATYRGYCSRVLSRPTERDLSRAHRGERATGHRRKPPLLHRRRGRYPRWRADPNP